MAMSCLCVIRALNRADNGLDDHKVVDSAHRSGDLRTTRACSLRCYALFR